jgi:hypothetical protein
LASSQAELERSRHPTPQALTDMSCDEEAMHDEDGGYSVTGTSCLCGYSSAEYVLDPSQLDGDCYVHGRTGVCLLQASAFTSCTPGEPQTCADVCRELEQRKAEDSAREVEWQLLHTACVDDRCHSVIRADDHCYVVGTGRYNDYDCAMSGEEILSQALADKEAASH